MNVFFKNILDLLSNKKQINTDTENNISPEMKVDFDVDYVDVDVKYFLTQKVGYFSQSISKSEASLISRLVAPDGKIQSWSKFKKSVLEVNSNYDISILKTEMNLFITMSHMYSQWKSIEKDKNLFPYLKYSAIIDGDLCKTCRQLNNFIVHIDDPFWDIYYPPNCPSCRCLVEKIDKYENVKSTDYKTKKLQIPIKGYDINVGKQELLLDK